MTKGAQGEGQSQDVGRKRHYTDPMGSRAPELERCLIRHRALQMMLILYYAEELKRDVINGIAAQMRWRGHSAMQPADGEGPSQEGKKQKRAFDQLVQDGVLTDDERKHMVSLIGRRNSIAHHLDYVTADLTTDRTVRGWLDYYPDRQTHDYEALDQLRAARTLLSERMTAHHYVLELDMRGMFFESTERVLSADLKTLERRIRALMRQRRRDIAQLNAELLLKGSNLTGLFDPRWPENRYGNAHQISGREPLDNEALYRHVPSIFAREAHDSRSDRYVYVPTIDIVEGLRREGWSPFFAVQSVPRDGSRHGHAKHMLRLRRDDGIGKPEAAEVIIVNSHDGTSAYQMFAGMLRFVCTNSMIAGERFEEPPRSHRSRREA